MQDASQSSGTWSSSPSSFLPSWCEKPRYWLNPNTRAALHASQKEGGVPPLWMCARVWFFQVLLCADWSGLESSRGCVWRWMSQLRIEKALCGRAFPSGEKCWTSPASEPKHFWQKCFPGNWSDPVLWLLMVCWSVAGRMERFSLGSLSIEG